MSKLFFSSNVSNYFVDFPVDRFSFDFFNHRFWIVDSYFKDSVPFPKNTIYIEALEENKSLSTCEEVLTSLASLGCTRHDSLGVVGGGLLQDIGTLVSSLYMRGLKWTFFPTTLMAMMDSCVGGKSSINVKGKKNLIGNFYPPREIHIYAEFIDSLTQVDIACGLLEGIKICYARDSQTLTSFYEKVREILSNNNNLKNIYNNLIAHSLESKKWFLEVDEFDMKERQLLNFGHTFGHALETATDYRIPHGIAVGFGMLAAIDFVNDQNNGVLREFELLVQEIIAFSKFQVSNFLPLNEKLFVEAFDSDKKHTIKEYFLILPEAFRLSKVGLARTSEARQRVLDSMIRVLGDFE